MSDKVQIILPACDDDAMSAFLRGLTGAIEKATGQQSSYGLGCPSGYGLEWDCDTFMMHPYCWCDRSDCPWCAGCECGEDYRDNPCPSCRNETLPAPNFWHKPSGVKVWWYKYIGRGMEIEGGCDLTVIAADCARAIAEKSA